MGARLHALALTRCVIAVALVAAVAAGCTESDPPSATSAAPLPKSVHCTASPKGPTYPLRVQGRHLADARGRPFLVHGDSAWSLIAQLRDKEVDRYLNDREARGFNTILVNLLEAKYATNAPANIYGDQPFRVNDDLLTPNEAYFTHADSVIQKAASRGILVLLDPAYFGYSDDGWYDVLDENGVDRTEQYGRYLGERYADCPNIMWVIGGDRTPKGTATGDALARGIAAGGSVSLMTAHADSEAVVDRIWGKYAWLSVNTLFTYKGVWSAATAQRGRSRKPFLLIESAYENDGWNPQTPTRMRTQAYQAILAGAAGHVFGNNPIWHFDGPGCCSAMHFPTTWQQALSSEGSRSMSVLRNVFSVYAWHTMLPDIDARFVTGGVSRGLKRVAAAVARDGSFAIAFVPSARTMRLNLRQLRSPVDVSWIDPTTGVKRRVASSKTGRVSLFTPGRNANGGQDWLLVAEARPGSSS